jgi:PAS domain S-box-containing protein
MLRMTVFDLRPSDAAVTIESQLARASTEGLLFEAVHRKKDGSMIPVEVSSVSTMMDNEKVLISIVRDISERKRAGEILNLLASIVTQSEDAIYGKTLDGTITSWNLGAEKIYGYTAEDAIGRPISSLAPPEYHAEIEDILAKVRAGEPIRALETVRVRKDGQRIDVSLSVSPVKNADGVLVGASTIAHDITNRKRSEAALALATKKLNIMYSITRHDILNQITALRSFIYLYHEECPTKPELESYYDQLNKITGAIENQISFTKSYEEIGVKAPVWQNVSGIASGVAVTGGLSGIRVEVETGTLELFADPLLEKVFLNMYDNARRHGEHVTEIRVSFSMQDAEGVLSIEDNGVGIPVPEKSLIFHRGVGKHTGLGLFLISEILAITGMSIRETGEPGKGARFEIIVPKEMFRFSDGKETN